MLWLIGLVIGFSCLIMGYVLHGGNVLALWQPTEILVIFGLGVGYLLSSNPIRNVKLVIAAVPKAFKTPTATKRKCLDVLCLMFEILTKVRRDGLMTLEADIEDPGKSAFFQKYPSIAKDHHLQNFICDYLRMMLGGSLNVQQVEALMEQELETHRQENHIPIQAIQRLADAFPAFGIVVAVMGVVHVMGSIGLPPAELGKLIGAALVGTFLGILFSYTMFSPIASAIERNEEVESKPFAAVKVILLASLNNFPPQAAVEFGRKVIFSDLRPTFQEMDAETKAVRRK